MSHELCLAMTLEEFFGILRETNSPMTVSMEAWDKIQKRLVELYPFKPENKFTTLTYMGVQIFWSKKANPNE